MRLFQVACENAGQVELLVQGHIHDMVHTGHAGDLERLFMAGITGQDQIAGVRRGQHGRAMKDVSSFFPHQAGADRFSTP